MLCQSLLSLEDHNCVQVFLVPDLGDGSHEDWTNFVCSLRLRYLINDEVKKFLHDSNFRFGNITYYCGAESDARGWNTLNVTVKVLGRKALSNSTISSATEIRQSLIHGDDQWRKAVPKNLHNIIEKNFPKEFLQR